MNGKIKEYFYENLIFDGEYLNGKKKNGVEYDIDKQKKKIFEGEYLNGKRWNGVIEYNEICDYIFLEVSLMFKGTYLNGKGKEFYKDDGNIKFDGKYLNGKKWNGKGYNIKGELNYEIKNGKGIIKEYYKNGNTYFVCEYINGKIMGK